MASETRLGTINTHPCTYRATFYVGASLWIISMIGTGVEVEMQDEMRMLRIIKKERFVHFLTHS
jgi:hypothetical protein